MKLKSFYKDPIYIITQSNHGINQAFTAFDFGYLGYDDKGLYGMADMSPKRMWGKGYDGGCEYWIDGCSNVYVQIVHFTPQSLTKVAQGSKFGVVPGDHVHVSLNVQGKWQVYLDYADRGAELFFWQKGQKHFKWTNWETYTDRQLICYNDIMNDIFTFNGPLTIETTNTVEMNVRKEPTTKAVIIGKVAPKTKFETSKIVSGETINGQPIWFNYGEGWISGEYVKDITDFTNDLECQAELFKAKQQISILEKDNAALKAELDSYKPITFYTKP